MVNCSRRYPDELAQNQTSDFQKSRYGHMNSRQCIPTITQQVSKRYSFSLLVTNPIPYHSCCLGFFARMSATCASLEQRGLEKQVVELRSCHHISWPCIARKDLDKTPQQMKASVGGADDQGVQALVSLHQCTMNIPVPSCSLLCPHCSNFPWTSYAFITSSSKTGNV